MRDGAGRLRVAAVSLTGTRHTNPSSERAMEVALLISVRGNTVVFTRHVHAHVHVPGERTSTTLPRTLNRLTVHPFTGMNTASPLGETDPPSLEKACPAVCAAGTWWRRSRDGQIL